MKASRIVGIAIIVLTSFLSADDVCAAQPPWVASRPISPEHYIGIGVCDKKESPDDYRQVAENNALFDLSSEITVNVSGSFVQNLVERTGLSEQDVRMEIRTASHARLTGHQLVGEWEDRNEYWVYYRIPKEAYRRMIQKEKEQAVAAAVDMTTRALAAVQNHQIVSALRFYFEALARVQDFIGENIQATIQGRSTFLFNEIYAGIQNLMADIRLNPNRQSIPGLLGAPQDVPFTATATWVREHQTALKIAGLPIRFDSPWRAGSSQRLAVTDHHGIAFTALDQITQRDNGQSVRARVDVDALCPDKDTRGFFQALIQKLTIPESNFAIKTFQDPDTYRWHREFEGRAVRIAAAYQTRESSGPWPKIHDELQTFIKSQGGRTVRAKSGTEVKDILRMSKTMPSEEAVDTLTDVDLLMVMVADGKFNRRDNPQNPFGGDVQFAGEVRTLAFKDGQAYFSDRYRGATGWNPMGEDMVLDVLALHVFKRWRTKYLQHLETREKRDD